MSASSRVPAPLLCALAVLLSACATAPKPLPAPAPTPAGPVPEGPITLGFGWREGLSAQVAYTSSSLRTGEATESSESRYRMRVEGMGKALRVVSEDLQFDTQEDKELMAAAGPVNIPTVVVSREGEFQSIEGAEEVFARLEKLLDSQGQRSEQKTLVLGMLRTVMVEGARATWHQQVGAWRGLTLEPGKAVTRQGRLFSSALANVEVPVTESLTYEGAVPCAEGAAEKRCVRLTLHARAVESELPGVKAAFVERMTALSGGQGMDVAEVGVEQLTELVTEPGALVPHRLRNSRRTRVVFLVEKDQRTEDDQRHEEEYVYVYPAK